MGRIITDPAVRRAIYTFATALVPILVGAGVITQDEAGKWMALGGAAIGMLTSVLAAVNTIPAAYVPRHAATDAAPTPPAPADDAGDHLEIIPAAQATSDTKADAAGYKTP